MEYSENYEKIKEQVLNLLEKSTIKSSIWLIEVEHVLPSNSITKKFTIEGRVSKKLIKNLEFKWLNELDKLEDAIFDIICENVGAKLATEYFPEYWLVSVGVAKGDKFVSLSVNDMDGKEHLITQKGNETLVIDVWATWCSYCQKPMEHNMHIMKEKEILDAGINIIGVSCDEDFSALKAHLIKNNWHQIPQYNYPNVRKNLDIKSIPCVVIVDKNSIIKHVGSPNDMKFVESIKNISKGGEAIVEFYDDIEDNVWFTKLEEGKKKALINELNNKMVEEGCRKASLVLTSTYAYEGLNIVCAKCKPGFLGKVAAYEMDNLKKFEDFLLKNYNFRNAENKAQVEALINLDLDF